METNEEYSNRVNNKDYAITKKRLLFENELVRIVDKKIKDMPDKKENIIRTYNSFHSTYDNGNYLTNNELELRGFYLEKLPNSLLKLDYLKELTLMENNLSTLPVNIKNLPSLKKLNLRRNKITSLPESIGLLSKLSEINLLENQLEYLPESIGNLKELTRLDLRDNKLRTIPSSISNLSKLEFIALSDNYLTTLPDSIRGNECIMRHLHDSSCFNGLYRSGEEYFAKKDELIQIKNSIVMTNDELTDVEKQKIEHNLELSNDIFISIMPEVKNINNDNYLTNLLDFSLKNGRKFLL